MSIWRHKGHYYIRVMHRGQIYRGERGYDKKEEAMEAQAQIKYKLKLTRRSTRTPVILQSTFLDLWLQYLKHCEAYNSKGWFDAKRYIGSKYFQKWFHEDITQIMPADIEAHLVERKNLSARSANLDFEILRNFFIWCMEMGFMDKSPMLPLRKFPLARKQKIIPSKEDIEILISKNEGSDRLLILLLVYTMGRISEIKGLQWKDVDLNKKVLYLKTRKTRDGSESIREIPINGLLLGALLTQKRESGYILSPANVENGIKPYCDLRKRLKKCLSTAHLSLPLGFHQFRHYGASMLANSGVPLNVIKDLLGHTTLDTTNIYLQSLTESKRKAMEML